METSINLKLEEIILLSKGIFSYLTDVEILVIYSLAGKDPSQYMLKDDVPNNDVLIIDKVKWNYFQSQWQLMN